MTLDKSKGAPPQMRPLTLELVEDDAPSEPTTCALEERAVINAIIAEEEAREIAEQAIKYDEITLEGEAKVRLLGLCVNERIRAVRALMTARRERR